MPAPGAAVPTRVMLSPAISTQPFSMTASGVSTVPRRANDPRAATPALRPAVVDVDGCGSSSSRGAAYSRSKASIAPEPTPLSGERVAVVRIAAAIAGREPLDALLGGTVRPRLGIDAAGRGLLDPVVADGLGRADRFLDVAGFEVGGLRVGPDTGEAVRLELLADGQVVLAELGSCCASSWTRCEMPSALWTWWPNSWATT